jgi:predicted ester cyclase/heme-degrading monooxygenase HmoA
MYARMNMLAGDPAQLADATRYLEGTVRPHVEAQHGNRGLACLINADLGLCVVVSYWDTPDALAASEHAVQISRKEAAERLRGTVAVEQYDVPVFVRRSRPAGGAGVRISRLDCAPGKVDGIVEEFRNTVVPALLELRGLASAQLMTDRHSGRCLVITAWEDKEALAASRAATAQLRGSVAQAANLQVRGVEEYELVFSSVRDGDTRSMIERNVELWNAKDRDGWLAGIDLHRFEARMPGAMRLTGRDAANALWNTYNEAFPDNQLEIRAIHADVPGGAAECRAIGTHTGVLRGPGGELPPTGKQVRLDFCGLYEFGEGKITSFHLYFDQAELLGQLGIAPPG